MAQPVSTEEARQGRNIKGMIWVLVIGLALVVIAYAVMLAFSAEPVTADGELAQPTAESSDAAAPNTSPATETQ